MTVQTSAGTLLAVSASQPATEDQTGYEALTYTNVGEVADLGDFGAVFERVDFNDLSDRITRKFKGSIDYGTMSLELGRDTTDAGQVILIAASDGANVDVTHSFKVTLQDGSVSYFQGQVFSYATSVGAANNIVGASVSIEINSSIVEVAA